ncbi:GntR family transcriptional regulator [Bacillus sp. FJAT-44742]|uniref:GntR family transcriptional regulator n=1 Tax=Bacillus sp. FJAT-44742 TaxID=2014005 RepID=UPI000C232DE4|nr:GntR family transcriptional regulator [Bacillus sp. FJAT-44742]
MNQQLSNSEGTSINITKVRGDLENIITNIEETRLPERAYQILRLAIRDLKLMPGKTILEREMAEVLEMSRTPVREALVRLQTEGVVKLIPRKGFTVEPIERDDLRETYEIVEVLEGLAASIATSKVENIDLEELESLVVSQEEALKENDLESWAKLDDLFHLKIIKHANNKRLSSVIEIHADQLYRARMFTISERPLPWQSIVEHRAILACMRAKDNKAAELSMQSHRKRARNEILKAL